MPLYNKVITVYREDVGHAIIDVGFKWKWQAILFHMLLNKSRAHVGNRRF
jgi:hypothetical protein